MTAVTGEWWCAQCQAGDHGPNADKEAEKHTKTTGHSTHTSWRPVPTTRKKA